MSHRQRIGVMGNGQLAMMLGEAAEHLPLSVEGVNVGEQYDNWTDIANAYAASQDVLTWERDDIPVGQVNVQADAFLPPLSVLECIQDRKVQKTFIDSLQLPTAAWIAADSAADATRVVEALSLPLVVKARVGGFDGRGQRIVDNEVDLAAALDLFSSSGSIVEKFVPFDDECAAIIVRDEKGETAYYPPTLTVQREGQLNWGIAPHPLTEQLREQCERITKSLAEALHYVGSIAVEFFRCGDQLSINEISPRVHNSGHWTIEGCVSSQFDNHLRAVSGLGTAQAELQHHCLMMNAIAAIRDEARSLDADWFFLHDYHKDERPNRKVGHYTIIGDSYAQLYERFQQLSAAWQAEYPDIDQLLSKLA